MLVILQAKRYVEKANTTELARHTRIQDIHNPDYSTPSSITPTTITFNIYIRHTTKYPKKQSIKPVTDSKN